LRRALSTAYYAVFHKLAKDAADLLVGGSSSERSLPAWQQTYRGLQHRRVREMCAAQNSRIKRTFAKFPKEIRDFAETFVSLQEQRHRADYDPLFRGATRTNVLQAINQARDAIERYERSPKPDRRAFCIFVMIELRA